VVICITVGILLHKDYIERVSNMKKKEKYFSIVCAFISILSLLYIRYYETTLYYKQITLYSYILDKMYEYIAIPSFYYFITTFITLIILNLFNINIPKIVQKILKFILILALILYIILITISIIGIITLSTVGFISIYSLLFSVFGCFFALVSYKIKD